MRTRSLIFLALIAFVVPGCASLMPGESGKDGNMNRASIPGHMPTGYMDRQEAELHQSIMRTDGTSLQRQEDKVCVTFNCSVLFEDKSTELKRDAYARIGLVADVLAKYPETSIKVDGFTDRTGSEKNDHQITESRANAVKDVLVGKGIDPTRIRARGFGDSKPLTTNSTEEGRQTNRRVMITIAPL